MLSNLKPESVHPFYPLSYSYLLQAFKNNSTITGYVEEYYPEKQYMSVRLNQDLFAVLPYCEATIYQNIHSNSDDYTLPQILKGKNVRVKITSIEGNSIFVSRKLNMMEALEYLLQCETALSYVYYITESYALADIGDGIIGTLHVSETCNTRIKSICEYIHRGDVLKLKIKEFDQSMEALLSYKRMFKTDIPRIGSLIHCTIKFGLDAIPSAYFVTIAPDLVGIMDVDENCPSFKYGERVQCIVVGRNARGLKLRFVQKLTQK